MRPHPSTIPRAAPGSAPRRPKPSRASRFLIPCVIALGFFLVASPRCAALPSFARQMNLDCAACHTEFPILTDMGRQFKLSGYTMSAEASDLPPIAFMFQPSFTQTQAGQAGGAAPGFKDNGNFALTQASIFYAGRLFGPFASKIFDPSTAAFLNKFGIFSQVTYDGIGKAWSWDNTDIRFADLATVADHSVTYGVYLNNNPTLQDPWNGTPAFGFPFSGSGLAPTPAAGALIDGALAGQVAGVGAYSMIDSHYYLDLGAYRTLSTRVQRALGVDPTGETQLAGLAPYWRLAYTRPIGTGSWELGTFGLATNSYPGRDPEAGEDHVTDYGLDSQFQTAFGKSDLAAIVTAIYERDHWDASQQLGNTSNVIDSLCEFKTTVSYLYDKTYGLDGQYFVTNGSADSLAYGTSQTGSPNSNGFVLEAVYLPLNKRGGPAFWPKSNIKFSLQYIYYNRFDGSSANVDGAGRSARDNNTLYLEAWVMF